jgi:hypothetical protein
VEGARPSFAGVIVGVVHESGVLCEELFWWHSEELSTNPSVYADRAENVIGTSEGSIPTSIVP